MKTTIHPKWNHAATVKCACGNTFATGSAQTEIQVDICSACHPFYTGQMKFIDTQGRVDRFIKSRAAALAKGKTKKDDKKETTKVESKSLKDLLAEEKAKLAKAEKEEKAVEAAN